MTDAHDEWTEEDSRLFQDIAAVAVPARDEQIATILALLPFARRSSFRVVELGCGEGALTFGILDCFPKASATALDRSPTMLRRAADCLSCFASRVSIEPFDLDAKDWLSRLESADCVVSSLCLHHLSAGDKQRLFAEVYNHLSQRGAFLIADLVEPQGPEARALFAETWDRRVEAQSTSETGSPQLFERFVEEKWNTYRFPDPGDRPSPLFEQLTWLKTVGFAVVDCFWLQAGHAIYGGYKARLDAALRNVTFAAALRSARVALRATSR